MARVGRGIVVKLLLKSQEQTHKLSMPRISMGAMIILVWMEVGVSIINKQGQLPCGLDGLAHKMQDLEFTVMF
jgi:hypothetical protein